MYALMITIPMKSSDDDLQSLLASYSQSLAICPGYVDHLWLRDGGEIGLLQLFEDEAALEGYVRSGLLTTLTAHPACDGHLFARRLRALVGTEREEERPAPTAERTAPVAPAAAPITAL